MEKIQIHNVLLYRLSNQNNLEIYRLNLTSKLPSAEWTYLLILHLIMWFVISRQPSMLTFSRPDFNFSSICLLRYFFLHKNIDFGNTKLTTLGRRRKFYELELGIFLSFLFWKKALKNLKSNTIFWLFLIVCHSLHTKCITNA